MTALKLYKFIQENDIELRWEDEELIAWVGFHCISEFTDMIGYDYLSDGGLDANLQYHCLALDIVPICEYFDIEPTDILEKE
jgi:hypothetical protein